MHQLNTPSQQFHHVGAVEIRPNNFAVTLPFEILDRKINISTHKSLTWGEIHSLLSKHTREGLRMFLVTTKGQSHLVLETDKNMNPTDARKLEQEVYLLLTKAIGRDENSNDVKSSRSRNLTVFGFYHGDDAVKFLNAYRYFREPAEPLKISETGMMMFYAGELPVLVNAKNINYIRQDQRSSESVVISFMSSSVFVTYPSEEIAEKVILKAQEYLMGVVPTLS